MDRPVVTELIQNELTTANLKKELELILYNETKKEQLRRDYTELRSLLHQHDKPSARAAQEIIGLLQKA
jgi:lipid-A-disaccharide synthase